MFSNRIDDLREEPSISDFQLTFSISHRAESLQKNQDLEFSRNRERFQFLKWSSKSLKNMTIVPPGSGICHQVNLEYLARVVFKSDDNLLFPDSLVGADSHTTMINGLGIVGWGVGGIEAEAVMLGQPVSLVIPQVVGYKLMGSLPPLTTSTDLVLTITKVSIFYVKYENRYAQKIDFFLNYSTCDKLELLASLWSFSALELLNSPSQIELPLQTCVQNMEQLSVSFQLTM